MNDFNLHSMLASLLSYLLHSPAFYSPTSFQSDMFKFWSLTPLYSPPSFQSDMFNDKTMQQMTRMIRDKEIQSLRKVSPRESDIKGCRNPREGIPVKIHGNPGGGGVFSPEGPLSQHQNEVSHPTKFSTSHPTKLSTSHLSKFSTSTPPSTAPYPNITPHPTYTGLLKHALSLNLALDFISTIPLRPRGRCALRWRGLKPRPRRRRSRRNSSRG